MEEGFSQGGRFLGLDIPAAAKLLALAKYTLTLFSKILDCEVEVLTVSLLIHS
jgi:hypothetical protein